MILSDVIEDELPANEILSDEVIDEVDAETTSYKKDFEEQPISEEVDSPKPAEIVTA